ncbi:MAG: sulfite exporter TauE/SafE family protein [Chloroflexi bacterium]|nr:sulfite exporter TauE/SafE family protein [Chloroflexota bacterium]
MELNILTLGTALAAGLLSFISPCCLPLVPAYLSYITGVSVEEFSSEQIKEKRRQVLMSAVAFAVGLALIFTILGATATAIGQVLLDYQEWLARAAGVLIIVFGLNMLGLLKISIFEQSKRLDFSQRRAPGFLGSVLMGSAFGVGWTPCVGPFLGSVLLLASQTQTVSSGMLLLFIYGLGLGLPFVVAGLLIGQLVQVLRRIKRYMRAITYASGGLLVGMGLLVFSNQLSLMTSYLTRIFGIGLAQ